MSVIVLARPRAEPSTAEGRINGRRHYWRRRIQFGSAEVSGPDELVRTAQCIGAPRGALGIRIVRTSLTGTCLPSAALDKSCRNALDLCATRAVRRDGPEVSNRDADVSIPLILGQAPKYRRPPVVRSGQDCLRP